MLCNELRGPAYARRILFSHGDYVSQERLRRPSLKNSDPRAHRGTRRVLSALVRLIRNQLGVGPATGQTEGQ